MPYNDFISDSWKNVEIYALDGYLVDRNDKSKTQEVAKNIEIGTKEELRKKIPEYKSSWNTDRKDNNIWVFSLRYLGNQEQNIQDSEEPLDEKFIDREFEEFAKDVFGAHNFQKDGQFQYSFFVEGRLTRAEFDEGMEEISERLGCSYELIDQTPEAPSRQYFSENLKLMYPDVKSYEVLLRNPRKLEAAKELFRKNWKQEFDPESELDREDIILLYNEYMEEFREWKPVDVKLIFNK